MYCFVSASNDVLLAPVAKTSQKLTVYFLWGSSSPVPLPVLGVFVVELPQAVNKSSVTRAITEVISDHLRYMCFLSFFAREIIIPLALCAAHRDALDELTLGNQKDNQDW